MRRRRLRDWRRRKQKIYCYINRLLHFTLAILLCQKFYMFFDFYDEILNNRYNQNCYVIIYRKCVLLRLQKPQ